jgi:hypothetical protein
MMKNYDIDLAKSVMRILNEAKVQFYFEKESGTILFDGYRLGMEVSSLRYKIIIHNTSITTIAVADMHADPGNDRRMYRLLQFLSAVNHQLSDGGFSINPDNGEIQFRCYRESVPDYDEWMVTVQKSIFLPGLMFRIYKKGMYLSVYEIMKPEDAVEVCEEEEYEYASRMAVQEEEDSDLSYDINEDEPFVIFPGGDDEDDEDDEADEADEDEDEEDDEDHYDHFTYKSASS